MRPQSVEAVVIDWEGPAPALAADPGRLVSLNHDLSGRNPHQRMTLTYSGIARARLAVVTVEMPALRDRREDIVIYVERFLDELGARGAFTFDEDTLEKLQRNPWYGNVRELRNVIERAAALGSSAIPSLREEQPALPVTTGIDVDVPFKTAKAALIDDFERAYCAKLLEVHGGNITQAARAAELDRVNLLRVLDKHGLRPKR